MRPAFPKGLTHHHLYYGGACPSYSMLRWGPALSAAPGSLTTSHPGRRAASPSESYLSITTLWIWSLAHTVQPAGGLSRLHLCSEGSTWQHLTKTDKAHAQSHESSQGTIFLQLVEGRRENVGGKLWQGKKKKLKRKANPPWSCSSSGAKVHLSSNYHSPRQHRTCFTQPKVTKYQWASWAHLSSSRRIQHLVAYVSQGRPSSTAVTITKYRRMYHFSPILHAHCRSAGALSKSYSPWSQTMVSCHGRGPRDCWNAYWLLVLLPRSWHWMSQGHTATYVQMDGKYRPLRQEGGSACLWTSTLPVGPQELPSTCSVENTLEKYLRHGLRLEQND